jgi:hypothetical protein
VGLTRSGLEILAQQGAESPTDSLPTPIAPTVVSAPLPSPDDPSPATDYQPSTTHSRPPMPIPNDLPPATAWLGLVVIVGVLGMLYYGVMRRKS